VSGIIGSRPFLWLDVRDGAGPKSLCGRIEKNSIALLSNYAKPALDPPSQGWLGRHCDRELVRSSGLRNSDYVDEPYDPTFLPELERLVLATGSHDDRRHVGYDYKAPSRAEVFLTSFGATQKIAP
jgi:hypothetical protein